jgi:hypothetical protein
MSQNLPFARHHRGIFRASFVVEDWSVRVHASRGSRGPACLCHGSPWGASLRTTVPLLAQEVFEFVHQLLRVKGVLPPSTWRLVPRRVIGLL